MKLQRASLIAILLVLALSAACGQATPAATPVPTETLGPPSATPRPSPTPKPTATPNLAATARADDFAQLLGIYQEEGYLATGDGALSALEPFKEEWAQLRWYRWWIYDEVDADFLFSAHYRWSTASDTGAESGCGIAIGIHPNGDHYAVFLDQTRLLFMMSRGGNTYEVGKSTGTGRAKFGNPAEADFALGVQGDRAFASVDGEVTGYSLSKDQSAQGEFGYSVLSGTNHDYGTRCEITQPMLWIAD